jgi:hypothetical protein
MAARYVFDFSTPPDSKELVVAKRPSEEDKCYAGFAVRYQEGEGITGSVLATGLPAIIPCIADEPEFQGQIFIRERKKVIVVWLYLRTITLNNEIIGTFAVDIPSETIAFLQETQRFLSIIADYGCLMIAAPAATFLMEKQKPVRRECTAKKRAAGKNIGRTTSSATQIQCELFISKDSTGSRKHYNDINTRRKPAQVRNWSLRQYTTQGQDTISLL